MYNLSDNIQNCLDFEKIPTNAIAISLEDINQSVEISEKVSNWQKQWDIYLNALAFFGLKEWLRERDNSLAINEENFTLLQPQFANFINGGCNLQIGEFKICLISIGSLTDELITLAKAVVDLPEFIPHFYVLVEVLEEQGIALVSGFITYQDLLKNRESSNLEPESDWNYQIPISWFDTNPNRLLLYLRCLESEAIALPTIPNRNAIASMQSELTALLPQLSCPQRELWEILTWEQATAVLTTPELISWLYKAQLDYGKTLGEIEHQRIILSDLFQLLTQPVLNVGRWLWDELDELAQQLSWVLLPITQASALRSPTEEFTAIVRQLQQLGLEFPLDARGAYQDLLLAGIPLRLYAVIWHFISERHKHEWTLLLILGTATGDSIPFNLRLRVSDKTSILVDNGLRQDGNNAYLFARVVGNLDEKFLVNVSLSEGVEITLPPFAFDMSFLSDPVVN
jgi:Protein of unknown function (DUF1822)